MRFPGISQRLKLLGMVRVVLVEAGCSVNVVVTRYDVEKSRILVREIECTDEVVYACTVVADLPDRGQVATNKRCSRINLVANFCDLSQDQLEGRQGKVDCKCRRKPSVL